MIITHIGEAIGQSEQALLAAGKGEAPQSDRRGREGVGRANFKPHSELLGQIGDANRVLLNGRRGMSEAIRVWSELVGELRALEERPWRLFLLL